MILPFFFNKKLREFVRNLVKFSEEVRLRKLVITG